MKFCFTSLAGKLTDIARHFSASSKNICTAHIINFSTEEDSDCTRSFSVDDWEADRPAAVHHLYPIAGGQAAYMLQTKTKKQMTRNPIAIGSELNSKYSSLTLPNF